MNSPAALIFDMDGTLLDTEPLYTKATQSVLDTYDLIYPLELKQQCMGGDMRTGAVTVIEHFELPLTPEDYLEKREAHLLHLFPDAPAMPGAVDFLQRFLGKLPMGVATSSHRHHYDVKMQNRDWDVFDTVVCGDDARLERGKPEPDIFLLCAEELGVAPEDCVAFEDSHNGVLAAKAAGMRVIAIDSPYVKPGTLDDAERKITHYDELADLF
jgi:pseudouridine-5'-monophosphatase